LNATAFMIKRQRILLAGRVQGVGMRPYVYRLASEFSLSGFVFNDTQGVTIEVQGLPERLAQFGAKLQSPVGRPPLLQIATCRIIEIPELVGETKFIIRHSDKTGQALSHVTADAATCSDCLKELTDPKDFRYRYPFINCTNCGPRYSIVKAIPYDRPNTTMSVFPMCKRCAAQYDNAADRRFHAQPVACPACGPKVTLIDNKGKTVETDSDKAINRTIKLLLEGRIVAIKGIGGFHLAADAFNDKAVSLLRKRKRREHKPFALMAASIEQIKEHAEVDEIARQLLESPQSPIVLVPKRSGSPIASSAASGTNTFGFMLCYAPLHHLLFKETIEARAVEVLVMTSGNLSDEPLIRDNDEALKKLASVADYFLMHDREILRQVDDSVVHIVDGQPAVLRRSRGYVPTPILQDANSPCDILAAGADMKNAFCLVKKNLLIMSEHIGDLEDAEVFHHYRKSVDHFAALYEFKPKVIVCDLHPGYISTQYARSVGDVKMVQVQHHWAHAASVIAEYGISGSVIGLSVDGTGYGTDGAIWGSECLIASLDDFKRFGHLVYYPLAGGDKAAKEPIRPLLGILKTFYPDFKLNDLQWLLKPIEPDMQKQEAIFAQIEKEFNVAQTSSMGRIFDAVAAMLGLGVYNYFEAQLPIALEAIAEPAIDEAYQYAISHKAGGPLQVDLTLTIKQLISDIHGGVEASVISAKFHNTVGDALFELARRARQATETNTVALSGGVFCNRFLTNRLIRLLKKNNFLVVLNRHVPANDGGIALGQAAIAARMVLKKGLY
jgi:hydrogenase maturation protein HypF